LSVIDEILAYEETRNPHGAGTLEHTVIEAIHACCPDRIARSVETGCGKSTILLSRLSADHTVFTIDDTGGGTDSSVSFARDCPAFRAETTRFVFGPTQRTLPRHDFDGPLDLALIDGPHGFPFPEPNTTSSTRTCGPGRC